MGWGDSEWATDCNGKGECVLASSDPSESKVSISWLAIPGGSIALFPVTVGEAGVGG
jgi:hypothetical protein